MTRGSAYFTGIKYKDGTNIRIRKFLHQKNNYQYGLIEKNHVRFVKSRMVLVWYGHVDEERMDIKETTLCKNREKKETYKSDEEIEAESGSESED